MSIRASAKPCARDPARDGQAPGMSQVHSLGVETDLEELSQLRR